MSHHLTGAGVDHVVLERHDVGSAWRRERWDSLRLLTPNWMTALPGYRYQGNDPDGFMTGAETLSFLQGYRKHFDPPVQTGVNVERTRRTASGFDVEAAEGHWRCRAVVAATGASSEPRLPDFADHLPPQIQQLTALTYRRPSQLTGDGGVLVVGASASGVQLADEIRRAGRQVTLAVGEHVRLPRCYRGRDIYWWLDKIGQLDERYDEVDDLERARRHASVQLVGNDEGRALDLNALRAGGVQIVGRFMGIRDTTALCSGSLANLARNADLKMDRLLRRIDAFVDDNPEQASEVDEGVAMEPIAVGSPPTELDLRGFSTVIWATGHRPRYPWLTTAPLDRRGRVVHDGGVTALPGLYLLGLPFLRRRRSNLIAGLGADATDLYGRLRGHLDSAGARRTTMPAPSRRSQVATSSASRVLPTTSSTGQTAPAARNSEARRSPSS
jgi:putative flavoprotein involved in K+ transport